MADIAYIPATAGFVFPAVVLDVWSRRVVGWAMAGHRRTELALDALDRALRRRRPRQVIHPARRHSALDYLSPIAYEKRELVPA